MITNIDNILPSSGNASSDWLSQSSTGAGNIISNQSQYKIQYQTQDHSCHWNQQIFAERFEMCILSQQATVGSNRPILILVIQILNAS